MGNQPHMQEIEIENVSNLQNSAENFVDEPANHLGLRTDKSEWISDTEIALHVRKQLIFTTF